MFARLPILLCLLSFVCVGLIFFIYTNKALPGVLSLGKALSLYFSFVLLLYLQNVVLLPVEDCSYTCRRVVISVSGSKFSRPLRFSFTSSMIKFA